MDFCLTLIKDMQYYSKLDVEFSDFYLDLKNQVENFMCSLLDQVLDTYYWSFWFKGALNPNFLNLIINRENFGSRNVLVLFLNLLLLKKL